MQSGFSGQSVLIAGGFRGIGLVLARLLLAEGARLFIIGRRPEGAASARKALEAVAADRLVVAAHDLATPDALARAAAEVSSWCCGKLHHAVIFLGSGKTPFGHQFPTTHWKKVFETNTFEPIAAAQAFLPMLVHGESSPSLTLTAALAGVERTRAPMTYSIAKTALIAYAKHLAAAVAPEGVRVNTISPGNVFYKGGRWEEILAERGDEIQVFLDQSVGMKRLGTAEELAWVYLSVMSPRNSFMTGANVVADGLQEHRIL